MKIENRGIMITEVPGVRSISVDKESAVIAWTWSTDDGEQTFTKSELKELHDAIGAALNSMHSFSSDNPAKLSWRVGPIPDMVTKVRDRDKDVWTRKGDKWQISDGNPLISEEELLRQWGPVTEV